MVDRIILATGSDLDICKVPLLRGAADKYNLPVISQLPDISEELQWGEEKFYVVGPVCETADSFGEFSISAKEHDHLIIYSVGAYGYSMASNYNSRLRAAEYLVDGSKIIEWNRRVKCNVYRV